MCARSLVFSADHGTLTDLSPQSRPTLDQNRLVTFASILTPIHLVLVLTLDFV